MAKKITKKEEKRISDKVNRSRLLRKARLIPQINIAAFDQANKMGVSWQISGEEKFDFSLWNLSIKSKESQGLKWLRFESKLRDFVKKYKIQVLAYELPAGRNTNPIIHSSKLICIIEKLCAELDLEYIEFSSTEVKKFATGNGTASKELMIQYANSLWGYPGNDDNEADSIHILHLLKSKIN
jgi:Holliday junction resolvasome RuvABC endonuclease subunit